MVTTEIIRKKRDGFPLDNKEIHYMVSGFTKGVIPDYQFSAFLMAVFLRGMNGKETSYLTREMLYSGKVVDLSDIKGFKVDKHSTGGVGDKTSLILAPVCAAAGVYVPMISGRGLGHSGGTLDKLESIPRFRSDLNLTEYKKVLHKCGAVLIGQTKDIAPADKLIYALRDCTSTVESVPLITASIMSKKLAEGIDGLVLDVKTGSGAFMREYDDAVQLAKSLITTARLFNKKVTAFITDMNQPLGNYIGNWFEVVESLKVLRGESRGNLYTLSITLAGAMLKLSGKVPSLDKGYRIAEEMITSGRAYQKFIEIIKLQKGDVRVLADPEGYSQASYKKKIYASTEGFLNGIDTYQIGMAAVELGAGRKTKEDKIDMNAGIIFYPQLGDRIRKKDLLAEIYTNRRNTLATAGEKIKNALFISGSRKKTPELIKTILD